jgi:hypothetical protein
MTSSVARATRRSPTTAPPEIAGVASVRRARRRRVRIDASSANAAAARATLASQVRFAATVNVNARRLRVRMAAARATCASREAPGETRSAEPPARRARHARPGRPAPAERVATVQPTAPTAVAPAAPVIPRASSIAASGAAPASSATRSRPTAATHRGSALVVPAWRALPVSTAKMALARATPRPARTAVAGITSAKHRRRIRTAEPPLFIPSAAKLAAPALRVTPFAPTPAPAPAFALAARVRPAKWDRNARMEPASAIRRTARAAAHRTD